MTKTTQLLNTTQIDNIKQHQFQTTGFFFIYLILIACFIMISMMFIKYKYGNETIFKQRPFKLCGNLCVFISESMRALRLRLIFFLSMYCPKRFNSTQRCSASPSRFHSVGQTGDELNDDDQLYLAENQVLDESCKNGYVFRTGVDNFSDNDDLNNKNPYKTLTVKA